MPDFTGIKLIAVDMDGTFLRDDKTYDQERFRHQFETMKDRGIRFVIASGNQYYRLKTYFENMDNGDIGYVAENGGYVHDGHETQFVARIAGDILTRVYEFLAQHEEVTAIICGKNSAYTLNTTAPEQVENARKHYQRLAKVESYQDINDTIIKIALRTAPELNGSVLDAPIKPSVIALFPSPVVLNGLI